MKNSWALIILITSCSPNRRDPYTDSEILIKSYECVSSEYPEVKFDFPIGNNSDKVYSVNDSTWIVRNSFEYKGKQIDYSCNICVDAENNLKCYEFTTN